MRKTLQNVIPFSIYHWISTGLNREWQPGTFGVDDGSGTFFLHHDAGFFSNCSVTLFELARSRKAIQKIDTSNSFSWYRLTPEDDIWPNLFVDPIALEPKSYGYWSKALAHHSRYRTLNLKAIQPLLEAYFNPSKQVLSRQNDLIKKYDIDLAKTLAVNYRGTDKIFEVSSTSIETWIRLTERKLLTLDVSTRILI